MSAVLAVIVYFTS